MGYVEESLLSGENVVATAKVHWMDLVVATVFFWWLFFIPPILALVRMFTTEIGVTDRRVIGKTGAIRRRSIDTILDKVSNIGADQGIFGRMFGYGTVTVITAGEKVAFAGISHPADFRRAVVQQMEAYNEVKLKQQAEAIAKGLKSTQ